MLLQVRFRNCFCCPEIKQVITWLISMTRLCNFQLQCWVIRINQQFGIRKWQLRMDINNHKNGIIFYFYITKGRHKKGEMRKRQAKFPNEEETQLYDKITKIQTKILDKLTYLKKNKKYIECKHLENKPVCEEYDPNINYYDKFWKTFLVNEVSHKRIQDLNVYLEEYVKKIQEVEDLLQKHEQLTGIHSKRRSRRLAQEIEKQCQCPYPKCFKIYGSDVSLNLHIKLKHNGGNKTDREKAAQLIWQARQKGKPIPQFYINLPPNFIEEYGVLTKRLDKVPQKPQHQ